MNETTIQYIGVDVAKHYLDFDLPAPCDRIANTTEAIVQVFATLPRRACRTRLMFSPPPAASHALRRSRA